MLLSRQKKVHSPLNQMEWDDSILDLESVIRFQSLSRQKLLLASSYPSVRLSAFTHAVPPGRISMKFDTGGFYGNLSKKSNLVENVKIIGYFSCCQRHYMVIQVLSSIEMVSGC